MRVADDDTAFSGIVAVARTNHLAEAANPCDTRGYTARARNDGNLDFAKETSHPNWTAVAAKPRFPGGLPKNQWIGYKFAVYDLPNGDVVNELWLDLTDGAAGGTWTLAHSYVDTGTNFGAGAAACAAGIDPALRLAESGSRLGSETGRPNLVVYFRATNVGTNGLVYKKMSVREIAPAGAAAPSDPTPAPAANPASFAFRGLYAFPNPARRAGATIRLRAGLADSADVAIYDASGARVRTGAFSGPTMLDDGDGQGPQYTYEYRWSADGAAPGVYTFAATARRAGSPDIKRTGRVALIK
jgi:hypothetical protein